MGLTVTPATVEFASKYDAAKTITAAGGVLPYTATPDDATIATVSAMIASPNLWANSDSLSSATLNNMVKGTGGPSGAVDAEATGSGVAGPTIYMQQSCPVTFGKMHTSSFWADLSQVIAAAAKVCNINDVTGFGSLSIGKSIAISVAAQRYFSNPFTYASKNLVDDNLGLWTFSGAVAGTMFSAPSIQLSAGSQSATSPAYAVTPGQAMSVSALFSGTLTSGTVSLTAIDQSGAPVPGFGVSRGSGTGRIAQSNFTVPAGVTTMRLVASGNGATISGTASICAMMLVVGADMGGWISPNNPHVSAVLELVSPTIVNGQKAKISQPMFRADAISDPYVPDNTVTFTVTPKKIGVASITVTDSTP